MYLVAIAWIYVVLMMAAAEATNPNGTLIGAAVTFLLYGVLPVSILVYIMGTPMRGRARKAREAAAEAAALPAAPEAALATVAMAPDASAAPAGSVPLQPDGGRHAPGEAIPAERKET